MTKTLLAIHSDQRDPIAFPNSSKFTQTFSTTFNKVSGIRIVQCEIPNSEFNIRCDNNTFTICEEDICVDISVPEGEYDVCSLISEIQELLNNNDELLGTYTLTTKNGKLIISSTVEFILKFEDRICPSNCKGGNVFIKGKNSIRSVLGFTESEVISNLVDGFYVVQAKYKINLLGVSVVYIYIRVGDVVISQVMSESQGAMETFYRVPLNSKKNYISYFHNQDCCSYYYKCSQIIKMKNIHLELRTSEGRLYETCGIPWSILIEVHQDEK